MPDLTPRLGIKKPLGNENVTRASFNENWDIIDGKVATLGADGKVPASGVSITDANNHFVASDVEGALGELFTSANDVKTKVKTAVIGKGGTVNQAGTTPTGDELSAGVNSIPKGQGNAVESQVLSGTTFSNADGTLRTGTMSNKVGSGTILTPGTADIVIPQGYFGGAAGDGKVLGDVNLLAANILSGKSIFGVAGSVVAGKRFATGTQTTGSSNQIISVSGLSFQPSIVIARLTSNAVSYSGFSIYAAKSFNFPGATADVNANVFSNVNNPSQGTCTISSSGFTITVNNVSTSYTWIAIE